MKIEWLKALEQSATAKPWIELDLRPGRDAITIARLTADAERCVIARIENKVSDRPLDTQDAANAVFVTTFRNVARVLLRVAETAKVLERRMTHEVVNEAVYAALADLQDALAELGMEE